MIFLLSLLKSYREGYAKKSTELKKNDMTYRVQMMPTFLKTEIHVFSNLLKEKLGRLGKP